jgi:hypothetical protein
MDIPYVCQCSPQIVHIRSQDGLTPQSPVLTYGEQGTSKPGVNADDHAIIHTDRNPPRELNGERRLVKKPIRVVPESPNHKLRPESRVNYAKVYTIEHNVKVCFIGQIHKDSEAAFFTDCKRTLTLD